MTSVLFTLQVPPTPFGEMGLKEWRHVLDTNLTAAFHVAQQARYRRDIGEIQGRYRNLTAAFHVAQQADSSPVSPLYLPYISLTSPLHSPNPSRRTASWREP